MTTGPVEVGEEQITLVLTVDKAELERQLGDVFGQVPGGRGRAPGVTPSSGEAGGKGVPVQPGLGFTKYLKQLGALVGISLGITSLVRSSKLMGQATGALQSVIGAMMDTLFAPLMPKIAEGISWLAEHGIPAMQKLGERMWPAIGKGVDTVATILGKGGFGPEALEPRLEAWKRVGKFLLDPVKEVTKAFDLKTPPLWMRALMGGGVAGPWGPLLSRFIGEEEEQRADPTRQVMRQMRLRELREAPEYRQATPFARFLAAQRETGIERIRGPAARGAFLRSQLYGRMAPSERFGTLQALGGEGVDVATLEQAMQRAGGVRRQVRGTPSISVINLTQHIETSSETRLGALERATDELRSTVPELNRKIEDATRPR